MFMLSNSFAEIHPFSFYNTTISDYERGVLYEILKGNHTGMLVV